MQKVPKKIYLQIFDEEGNVSEDITWCEDRINDSDIEYALVEAVEQPRALDEGDSLAESELSNDEIDPEYEVWANI